MTNKILGRFGAIPAGALYVFIHYALLVAYIAGAGGIVSDALGLPTAVGPVLFSAVMGSVLAFGSDEQVEAFNSAWVAVVAVSFLGLLALAIPAVRPQNLAHADWGQVLPAVPIMLVALVYHNVVPSVASQLRYDREAVSKAIVVGSGLPLLMFLLWNAVILGMTSPGAADVDPLGGLREGSGGALVGGLVSIFSEAAIITSFTGFVIGLLSFFKDIVGRGGEEVKKDTSNNKASSRPSLALYAAVILPPAVVALLNPKIFDQALEIAGTYGISLLFGVLPVVLSVLQLQSSPGAEVLLPGGLVSRGLLLALVLGLVGSKALALF
jgi:tyrosine-specific transport protein